ncbi:unnamed protein product [Lepeophtheirus salmonis]|uniref:(salmon louse) hypothetical protein n=1 Tax=Lepeophtheirus salmonis TaxID=72036 RepID=A0A7R8H7V4_LEPSM|nr:unnamed protein product [Lepeophtheirus salmonis]CAF2926027.1 unnamed protein product [Lepeophtheirus salmonis]
MHSSTQIASLISLIFLLGVAFSLPAERSPSPSNAHYDMIQEEGQRDRGPNSNLEWLLASDIGHRAEKRGFGLSDPRSLFANIYGKLWKLRWIQKAIEYTNTIRGQLLLLWTHILSSCKPQKRIRRPI